MKDGKQYWAVVHQADSKIVEASDMTEAKKIAFGYLKDGMVAYPLGKAKDNAIKKYRTLDRSNKRD